MKKARVLLAAVAIASVLAGTFAFKTYRSTLTIFTTSVYSGTPLAAFPRASFTTAGAGISLYYTTISTQPATNYAVVTANVN